MDAWDPRVVEMYLGVRTMGTASLASAGGATARLAVAANAAEAANRPPTVATERWDETGASETAAAEKPATPRLEDRGRVASATRSAPGADARSDEAAAAARRATVSARLRMVLREGGTPASGEVRAKIRVSAAWKAGTGYERLRVNFPPVQATPIIGVSPEKSKNVNRLFPCL